MLFQCVLPFNSYFFFFLIQRGTYGLSPSFYVDISKVESAELGAPSLGISSQKGAAGCHGHQEALV